MVTILIYVIIELIAIAGLAWGIHLATGFTHEGWGFIMTIVCGVIALIFIIGPICTTMEYNEFEKSFEFLANYYETFDATDIDNNYVYTMDIVDANRELAGWQAKHELYGIMSIVPDRVMNISPIGLR